MKKLKKYFVLIAVLTFLLVGCTSEGKGELTRIDIDTFVKNQEPTHIQDKDTLVLIENLFKKIKWQSNQILSMAKKPDLLAVFFYEEEKNMPNRLYEYEIWFNATGTATIIINDEKEGYSYGELDKNNAKTLKNHFSKGV
ncbi:hypothetical protein AB1282_20140 [Gottfriedia sp. S16(2024)]|uniref:hypothetical protein n=1 Tax=Gottfriedia sp. S16(2024) TaxID=3162883 RepID=UPI003D1A380B